MTTEHGVDSAAVPAAPGLRSLVYAALPPSVTPTDTACQPLSAHVLQNAQGDVVELTKQRMSDQFGDDPHVVLVLRDGDLDPGTDGELLGLLEQTHGGVLVFGVSYVPDAAPAVARREECPECGARNAFAMDPGAAGVAGGSATLLECRECGTVWDA